MLIDFTLVRSKFMGGKNNQQSIYDFLLLTAMALGNQEAFLSLYVHGNTQSNKWKNNTSDLWPSIDARPTYIDSEK